MKWLHRRKARKLYAAYERAADTGWVVAGVRAWTRYCEHCHRHDLPITGKFHGIR